MVAYFAYGSNMLTARLRARCPSAAPIGLAVAEGHRRVFGKRGRDGSGKATLLAAPGAQAAGVLFALDPADLPALDAAEGAGRGYDRLDAFPLRVAGSGARVEAAVYIAPPAWLDPGLAPFDWYLALTLAGARQHGLPAREIAALSAVAAVPDPLPDRPARAEALALLGAG